MSRTIAKYIAPAYAYGAHVVVNNPVLAIVCLTFFDVLFIIGLVYLYG